MEKIKKEKLEKEEITFLFEYNGYIKTYRKVKECSSIDTHIPILVLDNQYTFNIKDVVYKKETKKVLWWNKEVDTDEIDCSKSMWYNKDLDLYIDGETIYSFLMEYIDKCETAYQARLERIEKDKLEYREKLTLNKKD